MAVFRTHVNTGKTPGGGSALPGLQNQTRATRSPGKRSATGD